MTSTDPRLAHGSLPVLIWTAGVEGTCDYLNERWSAFTGLSVADLLGWAWLERVHPDDRERLLAEYRGALTARGPVRLEFRMLHRDGAYHWFLGTGEPCYAASGQFLGYSGCTTDVTDRRALEQRLAELGRTAEIAQLARGIAHDFNNVLTGILGHVALLQDDSALAPEAREDLAQIRQAVDRAATLSRQLLGFSRRPHLAPRSLDLNQLIAGLLSAIRQVVGSAVEVGYELEDGLEPVLADTGQLEQILIQLGAHGRAAMPGGGKFHLRTGRAQVDDALAASQPGLRPGSYVTLEVSHTGPGLGSEALARVFDPPAGGASGGDVDLSSVAGIARQSGGHVAVVSVPGEGTTFTLYLPRLEGAAESPVVSETALPEGSETILLVEDDPQVREVGRRALERAGYIVLAAGDTEAAIATADRHAGHIHLLVTDVVLPRVSGRELAARLAIHRPAIKVLYVSGTSDGAIARHQMLEPGIEFLEKPFSLDRLLRKVRQVLGADLSAEDATPWTQRSLV
jgi:two-component system, cell cycle sensor histidine kinase and response regulator CckA